MALKSTVYRADLTVSDLDRHVYGQHALTLARHPSETEERLMVRLLAFALYAGDGLTFGRGLSTEDEGDLWERNPTGAISLWIDVGLPEEKDVRKACGRADQVVVVAYGVRRVDTWWAQNSPGFARLANLSVLALSDTDTAGLQSLAARSMKLTCTIQEGHVWFASDSGTIELTPERRQLAAQLPMRQR
jgi:uncharacterized protein YaeQ